MPNHDYQGARALMVDQQIGARGISDARVLTALARVPRHLFVEEGRLGEAYADHPLPIGQGQTISQPYIVALMTELLQLQGHARVLEIGTGSGYQAAVLAELCREVISVERFPELAARARGLLADLCYENVRVVTGDGSLGYQTDAPYDAILVTCAAPKIAKPWLAQLVDGGRLVVPVGGRGGQSLLRVTMRDGQPTQEDFGPVVFVPLIGQNGWEQ